MIFVGTRVILLRVLFLSGLTISRSLVQMPVKVDKSFYLIKEVFPHKKLPELVARSVKTFPRYLINHPCGLDTEQSFRKCEDFVHGFYKDTSSPKKVILDSGCGKGLSTVQLAKLFPHYPVIGLDRSHKRLLKNEYYTQSHRCSDSQQHSDEDEEDDDEYNDDDSEISITSENSKLQNLMLLKVELSSFWNLLAFETDWIVHRHYLLHPNPYPKQQNIKLRIPSNFCANSFSISYNCFAI
jgi:tRNA G46 methylase TrmB